MYFSEICQIIENISGVYRASGDTAVAKMKIFEILPKNCNCNAVYTCIVFNFNLNDINCRDGLVIQDCS